MITAVSFVFITAATVDCIELIIDDEGGSTCCQNERYRQRLQLRQMFGVGGRVRKLTKNLIL